MVRKRILRVAILTYLEPSSLTRILVKRKMR